MWDVNKMVAREQATENGSPIILNPVVKPIIIERNMAWVKLREHSSAFRPVNSDHRTFMHQMLSSLDHPDDTTQVTWSSVHNYRCSASVSNTRSYWKQPEFEDICNDSNTGENEDDEDEEIDVGNSYDDAVISVHSISDYTEESSAPITDVDSISTAGSISKFETHSSPRISPPGCWSPNSEHNQTPKESHLTNMEIEFAAEQGDPKGDVSVLKRSSNVKCEVSSALTTEHKIRASNYEIAPKEQTASPLVLSHEQNLHSPLRTNITFQHNNSESFGLNWRNTKIYGSSSDIVSPILKSPPSIGSSSESINSLEGDILRRNHHISTGELLTYRRSAPSCPIEYMRPMFISKDSVLERSSSTDGGILIRRNPLYTRSYPLMNCGIICNSHEAYLQSRRTLGPTDLSKKINNSLSSYGNVYPENLVCENKEKIYRTSSSELPRISNLNLSYNKSNEGSCSSIVKDMKKEIETTHTIDQGYSSEGNENASNSIKQIAQEMTNIKSEHRKDFDGSNLEESVKNNDLPGTSVKEERKLVVSKNEPMEFSDEDYALRSRVMILLWILLGERRLRGVGYPNEPVHRLLWRAVDICCSVAGVKSAAAVPLNSDHDCGSDMLCFRDHTHRFLEVCAPTREHWKKFGWASLTVDAVVRKIYHEELMPFLRIQSLPADLQKVAGYLAQLERPSVMVVNPAQAVTQKSEPKQNAAVPPKKKRGRPAKVTHKIEEGGRIERVMLWRFLLNLLEDPKNSPCIHWVQREEGIFRILNTDWLARLWGRRHGNPRMTYEKMARAMRTYYRSKVLQPVPRLRNLPRKLVYKFNPAVIQKVAAMKLSCSTFTGRGMNYNK